MDYFKCWLKITPRMFMKMSPCQCACICCVDLCVDLPSPSSPSARKFDANFNLSAHVLVFSFTELDETPEVSSVAWLTTSLENISLSLVNISGLCGHLIWMFTWWLNTTDSYDFFFRNLNIANTSCKMCRLPTLPLVSIFHWCPPNAALKHFPCSMLIWSHLLHTCKWMHTLCVDAAHTYTHLSVNFAFI